MSIEAAVAAGRRAAEQIMTDQCLITRASAEGAFDPDSGTTTYPVTTLYEDQKCRVRVPTIIDRDVFSGQHEWTLQDSVLSLPVEVTGLRVKDRVEMTMSALDPDLVGQKYTIMAVHRASHATARRVVIRQEEA